MTLLGWMFYTGAVGALVASAAWCMDRGLGHLRLPTRWVWAGAMALALALPAVALLSSYSTASLEEGTAAATSHPATSAAANPARSGPIARSSTLIGADRLVDTFNRAMQGAGERLPASDPLGAWILLAWTGSSLALAALLARAALRLRSRRRGWPLAVLHGRAVRISPDTGPAVVGVLRPEIVIPDEFRRLGADELDLILEHESEHLRAHDSLLLGAALVPLVLLPWNPALWWQFHRLRAAVELDCDRRVLGRGIAPTAYACLLVRIGSGGTTAVLPTPALAGSTSLLEKRLKAMKKRSLASALPLALIGAIAASGLLLLACEAEVPTPARDADEIAAEAEAEAEAEIEVVEFAADSPQFTPFTTRPEVLNRPEIERIIEREYPPELRDAGVGGTVLLHFYIDDEGRVQNTVVYESSGSAQLDAAAHRVAPVFRFSPALDQGERVPVWLAIPIAFAPGSAQTEPEATGATTVLPPGHLSPPPQVRPLPQVRPRGALAETPQFTPHTVSPKIENRPEIRRALEREYPTELRDAGIGGTVVLHFFIDEEGRVQNTVVLESSGTAQLDAAAQRVAEIFQFSPALNRETRVPVWIAIPVAFETR